MTEKFYYYEGFISEDEEIVKEHIAQQGYGKWHIEENLGRIYDFDDLYKWCVMNGYAMMELKSEFGIDIRKVFD
jgi:hypothetical protein